jgi:hypothetical protein
MKTELFTGLELENPRLAQLTIERGIPVMVSANRLWDNKRGRWKKIPQYLKDQPRLFLDSGGFVAMKDPGPRNGFRFSLVDYCRLVQELKPVAWAACDYCVEPEIIAQGPSIMDRIAGTVQNLSDLNELADWFEIPRPVPVLQGWEAWHYEACLDMFHRFDFSQSGWPPIIGIGSVCRRDMAGSDGLREILAKITPALPAGTALHLFGVKGKALGEFADDPKIASVDSMAWAMAARWEAKRAGVPCSVDFKIQHFEAWRERNLANAA